MDHQITLKFQSDSKEVKKDINEIKQLISKTDKSMTLPNYKELAKTLGQLEKSSQKIGMNLGGAAKSLTSAVKDLVQKDFQQLMNKTDQYSQILIRTRQKIDTLDKQGRIDEANHYRAKEARYMKRMNVNAVAASESFDMLGGMGSMASQPTSGAGRTPQGVPIAPPAGKTRGLFTGMSRFPLGQRFGVGVGAAALETLQAAPSLYANPYTFAAQVNAPQVQRNAAAYRGDFTDYLMEAKYGMLSKAYSQGKTAARIGLGAEIGGGVGRGALTGLQTGMFSGNPAIGAVAGVGTAATGAGISAYSYGLQGGGTAKQAQAAEDFIAKMKASSSLPGLYQKVLARGPRNLQAMRSLGLTEGQLEIAFKNASTQFMGQEEFLQTANTFRGVTGSKAAAESAIAESAINAKRVSNKYGYNLQDILPTQQALASIDKRGAVAANSFFSSQKALGFKDTAIEQALAEGAINVAANAGGQTNVETIRNFISQGLSPGFATSTPESQMRQMQGAIGSIALAQNEANAGGIGQFLQAKIAGKYAGADIGKALVIQQELSNSLETVQSGTNPILARMHISKEQQIQMGKDLLGFQNAQYQSIEKGHSASEAGIRRAAAAGIRPTIETGDAEQSRRRVIRAGLAGKFAKGKTGKQLSANDSAFYSLEASIAAKKQMETAKASAAVKGIVGGEQLEQNQIEQEMSGPLLQDITAGGLKATAANPKTQDPTKTSAKDIDRSMDKFLKALDRAADNINSKFGQPAHG